MGVTTLEAMIPIHRSNYVPFPCYSWSGFYCFIMTLPHCPPVIRASGVRDSLGGSFLLLIVFTFPIATHFGSDHNILYSVN